MPKSPSRASLLLVLGSLALLYAALAAWPLTDLPLKQWDESRLSVNALEMIENGQWLVTHFDGKPEMWNTKPPLLIWAMALSMKLFGLTDFAARLPAAAAGLLTVLLLAWFTARQLQSARAGFLAGFVLVTSMGFMGVHAATSADYDAPLTLCLSVMAGAFFLYVESGTRRYFALAAAALAAALLTKSVAALMPLPALFAYLLLRRRLGALLRDPAFYLSVLGAIAVVLAYYFAREARNPGYIAAVLQNEIFGRYFEVNELHEGSANFYLRNFWAPFGEWSRAAPNDARFIPWLPLAALGTAVPFFSRDPMRRRLGLLASLWTWLFLLVISSARTKLYWYDVPLYPAAALLAALALEEALQRGQHFWRRGPTRVWVGLALALLLLVAALTNHRLRRTWGELRGQREYVSELRRTHPELDNLRVLPEAGSTALQFYLQAALMRDASARTSELAFVGCRPAAIEALEARNELVFLHRGEKGCATVRRVPPRSEEARVP